MADTVKGVDISVHNGDVDFEMLKRNGISFVMIGMGNRFAEKFRKRSTWQLGADGEVINNGNQFTGGRCPDKFERK